ncbi:MAG: DUF4411 family protein [Nanoarchaeota archaeon]|nr:DUF4411 family protein [Nanoarchaeota archaeon]MBU4283741.1 DUF4411 family protein [Nanoarchaeota archaeon]
MSDRNYYVIDTSSLIDLNYRYPVDVFPGIWKNLEKLIANELLLSPKEVLKEIKDESLKEWAKKQKKLFRELDELQVQIVQEILKKYPSLAKPDKDGPQADPFVIALAVSLEKDPQKTLIKTIKKRIIVTEERLKGSKEKIPFVCKDYDIDCINVIELFRTEGWKFQ